MSHNARFSFIYIITFLLLFFSCDNNKSKLVADYKKDLTIDYKKDSIFIDYGDGELEKFFKINNEYYLIEDNKKKLFFSTVSDTVYYDIDEEFRYKVEIKKINSSTFKTSYYYFDEFRDVKGFLYSFQYDINYKILKIEKGGTIDYLPR